MQQNNKRIAKNTLLLYFRMLFTMAISLYTSRVVLATLGIEDFGIYNVVGGFVAMFSVISGAMTSATQRFISYEIGKGEEGNVSTLFTTAVIIHIFLGGIVLILAETIGLWFLNTQMNFPENRYVAVNWVFQFSIITFIVNVISVPYNAAIIAYERMKAFAYVSIIEVTLKLLIVYLLVISSVDKLILYAFLLALVAVTIRLVYGLYCKRYFTDCHCNWIYHKSHGAEMFSFVSWNLIGSVASVTKEQGINIVLNIFFGASVNAARGIAYQVLNALNGFVNNFQLAMNPQIVKSYAAGEKEAMFQLVYKGSKFSYLMLLLFSLPILIETPFILNLWLEEVPQYTTIFLRLVLITALIDSLSGTLITSMHASGRVRNYQLIVGTISLLTLPVAYIFLKNGYPPYSAMIVGVVIAFICHFARLVLLGKIIGFPISSFLLQVTFRVFVVSLFALLMPVWLYSCLDVTWLSFIIVCIVCVISTMLSCYYIGLKKNERDYIKQKIGVIISKVIR